MAPPFGSRICGTTQVVLLMAPASLVRSPRRLSVSELIVTVSESDRLLTVKV